MNPNSSKFVPVNEQMSEKIYPWIVNTEGKIKFNLVAAVNKEDVEKIMNERYPSFANSKKNIKIISVPQILF
jgi:uncharacterized protein YdhG (YjbR/CyaY superfamily)